MTADEIVHTSETEPKLCPKGHIEKHFGECTQDCFAPSVNEILKEMEEGNTQVATANGYRFIIDEEKAKLISGYRELDKLHMSNGRGYKVGKGEGLCANCGYTYPCPTRQITNKTLGVSDE